MLRVFKKALITGITGSGGSYLADHIVEHHPEVEVHGIARWHSTAVGNRNLEESGGRVTVHECDLTDFSSIFSVLKSVKPDVIFHLASYANVRTSFDTPLAVIHSNVMGTANLLEAARLSGIDPVLQICSTSEVYGQVDPEKVPVKEDAPLSPLSPYAASKVTQDLLGYTYFKVHGMKIIRTRMFTYLNPRRNDIFATSFAKQVARIEQGLQKEVVHGNLDSVRTVIDVRDAMEAYWVAAEKCRFGEVYNIGGSTVITVKDFLDLLKKHARCVIPTRLDPKLLRPTDITLQRPDSTKFTEETGWKPKYGFEDSVKFLLDYCRKEAAREKAQHHLV